MIFCVEDDDSIRELMIYVLMSSGFKAAGFSEAGAMWAALEDTRPELILLDIMLPGEDGISVLKKLRSNPKTESIPVIMATAKGAEYDKVLGLDSGADDYLVKPFGMMEMVSRVRAVLRRCAVPSDRVLRFGPIELSVREHRVTVSGEAVALTLKEFDMLRLLMENPGTVFTRDRLLSEIWDIDYDGETRTVDVHVRTLRSKLGEAGSMIATVRGVGYRLEAPRS